MSNFLETTFARARENKQTIVLPEGNDIRTLEAARQATDLGIANIIVLASADKIAEHGVDMTSITVIDPQTAADREQYASLLYDLRKAKGLSEADAHALAGEELHRGVLMVYQDAADGMVAGAAHATSDVLRPCLQILKTAPNTSLVSAFFVIVVPDCEFGADGAFIFADSGLVQHPDAEQLSDIAISSAQSFASLLQETPVVAMLSHSTKGSAKSPSVDKVAQATALAKAKAPNLALDGELQLDAAIVPSVGSSKAPGSDVAGKANVLIFPDLDSGNIGYKLAQRLAKAEAYGPITQGIAKPVNDLSRGATASDIVGVIAITCVQSQARKSS
jgi:phosphate acetyltransferase